MKSLSIFALARAFAVPTMKYSAVLGGAALSFLLLSACQPRAGEPNAKPNTPVMYMDPDTGCEYIATGQLNALTRRADADGMTHRGCRKTEKVAP